MTKQNWIYTFLFILGGYAVLYLIFGKSNSDLVKNSEYICGRIYDYFEDTKGHSNISYEYYVKNERFTNMYVGGNFEDCEKTGWCIGKCYEIRYSSKNPKNSRINLEKECNCSPQLKK